MLNRRGIKSKLLINFLKKNIEKAMFFVALVTVFSFIGKEVFAIPNLINYQGRLRDSGGTPIITSTTIQFSIYNNANTGVPTDTPSSAGPLLWTEVYDGSSGNCPKVQPDAQGYFTVNLGACGAFPSYLDFSTGTYYLAVKIESDNEASPRVILATHPYAFNSDRVDGFHASSTAAANTLLALDNNLNLNILSGGFTGANLTMNSSTATSSISGNLAITGNTLMATTTIANLILTGASSFGTISAGTWQGDIIATNYGGTGQDTSGWTGFVKINNGIWSTSTVNLTSDIAGILPIENGGTNASSFSNNEFIWFNGTSLTGSGFTSTSFMVSGTDNWVNVAGDTMTGALIINNNLNVTGSSTLSTTTITQLMVGENFPAEIPSGSVFASYKKYTNLSNSGDGFTLGNVMGIELDPIEDASTTINTLLSVTTNEGNNNNFEVIAGLLNQVIHQGSGSVNMILGQISSAELDNSTGSVGVAFGLRGQTATNGSGNVNFSGNIGLALGLSGYIENGIGNGIISNASAIQSDFGIEGGNIGTAFGMRINNPTSGTGTGTIGSLYGLYIEEQNFAQNSNFNIYSDGTASINYFGGSVGIGTTSPLSALDVYGNLSVTGANRYLNFGNNTGTVGYGLRDNAGVMQWKNASGDWNNFSTKINHIVNVAKSGGDFDNLEDAVAFANNVNQDTIINIYPGVYEVSSTLFVTNTYIKSIRGMGREAVVIRPTTDLVSSPGPIFEINFSEENDFSLRLLTIDGSQTAGFQNTAGCDAVRISNTGSIWMDFSELVIIGTETGIDMQVANLLNIFKTDFYSIGNIGVDLDNGASAQVENVYMEDVENRFVHLESTTGSSSFYMVGSEFGSNSDLGTGLFIEGDASYAEIRYSNMWGLDYNIITNNNSRTKVTASYLQKAATLNIDQKDSSAINISSSDGAFSSADISINNPANVYFYALAEEEGVVLFGRHSNINQDVIKIDTGMAILPKLSYQADYYRNSGLIFVNDNPGERTMLGVQATSSEAKLSAISGDRSAIAGLYLYSDTDGFGSTSSMRGWMISKYGENSNLLFNFYNNDTGDGKSLINNKLMTLDGFNSQMFFEGGVIFNTSSGNYDFQVKTPDNDYTLFVQGSSDNVGIGTSTPNSQLTVDGDIDITGSYLMNGVPLTTVDPGITEGQFAYWDGDSWAPTSNIFVSSSGFIGIGTTTPKNALTLIGGLSICSTSPTITSYTLYNLGGQLYWNGSPVIGGNTSTYIQDSDGDTKVETEASPNENRIHFQTAGTERVIIDENGLVAINTTTVNGKAFYLYGDTNDELNLAIHNNNAGPSSTAEFSLYNDLGKLGGLTALSSGWDDGLPGISGSLALYSINDLLFSTMASGGDIIFDVDPTDEQRSMVIAGTGGGNAGYVGIGTSTPLAPLSINGNVFVEGENRYINFGTTTGAAGYGFRDNNGIMELRNINNNHNVWSEIVINDALKERNIIYVNTESGKDTFDGQSPAKAKKTISAAITTATASTTANSTYLVKVAPGTYTENISMADYVRVEGSGRNTVVSGTITFNVNTSSVLEDIRIVSTNDYAVKQLGSGRATLTDVVLETTFNNDAGVQAAVYQEKGTMYVMGASQLKLTRSNNAVGEKINSVYYFSGSSLIRSYVLNTEHAVATFDNDDDLSLVYSDNTNAGSVVTIKDPVASYSVYASAPTNTVKNIYHNGSSLNTYIDAEFSIAVAIMPGAVKYIPAYIANSGNTSTIKITNSSFSWSGPGMSEENIYLAAAITEKDKVALVQNGFDTDNDIFPFIYTADGASGTVNYFIENGHGNIQNNAFATYDGSFGIGTSTPYDRLEVWGADLSSSPTSSRNYITIVANGNGEAGHYIRRVNSGSYDNGWSWYMPTSSLDFRLWDDSVGAEGDDILTVQAGTGHIGIGQALYDPLNKLHVDGGIYLGDTATATTTNSVYNIGGDLYWNGNLLASAGGATANWLLTSHNGGNVLTTSTTLPVWFKDIIYASSSVYIDGTLNVLGNSILATTTISDLTVNNINVLGTVSTTDILVADSITLGGVTCNTWPISAGGSGIWSTTTANVAYPNLSGDYAVVIGNSATSSNVKFEVLGDTKLGGALTVTGKSNVNGTSTLTGPVLFGDYAQFSTVGNNNLYFNNNTGNYLRWNNTGGRFEFSNPLQITGFVSSTDLQVNGNATTTGKMYIGSSLSIGIPDPNYHKLEIYEANADVSAEIKTASSSKVSVINVKAGSDTDFLQIGYYGSTHPGVAGILPGSAVWDSVAPGGSYFINESTQDDAALIFMTGGWQASNERLRITAEGKIGIGTSTPQDTLSVKGLNNSNLFGVYTSSSLLKFAVDNIGRVGIGTGTPQAPLHVVTDQTGPAMTILQKTIAGATNLNFVTNNNKYWQLSKRDGTENDKLRFYFNDGSLFYNVFTLGSTGTVGINNDNPDAMLSVVGTSTYPLLNISTSSSAPYLYMNNLGQVSIGTSANPGVPLYVYGNTSPVITRNIGVVGGAQSALQIGVDNTTAPAGTGPSYLFFANDAAGNKEFLGRLNAVWEDSTNGAERGAITLSVRNGSGDTTANTEAVRITSYGFVGLSTSTPPAFLSLYTNTSSLINITNSSTGYALLEGKYLSQNFGMSLEAGALIAKNSYFGEEFMRGRANITADTLYAWGDFQQFTVDENTACTWNSVANGVNGIGRQRASNGANSCLAYHGITAAGTANLVFNTANLPIINFKASPSVVASNRRFWIGISDLSQAKSSDPTNGLYFTNNTVNGEWQGVSRRAGASTVVDCAGQTINTAVFGVAKIEVVSSNGDGTGEVNFYIDNDATNGVDWFYCGQATTNIPTVGLTSMIMNNTVAGGGAQYIDIDYYRVWQDDSTETPMLTTEEIVEEIPEEMETNLLGQAQIMAGDISVKVDFEGEYAVPPMMGITPLNFDGRWKLQNVTTRGFEITLTEQATDSIIFNWQAYKVEDNTKIYSSNGTVESLKDFYNKINEEIILPPIESSGESTPSAPIETPAETPIEPVTETPPAETPVESVEETPSVEEPAAPAETPTDVPME